MRTILTVLLLLCAPGVVRADVRLTEAEAKANAMVKPLPEYPPAARQLKVTGKVELEVIISPEGKVEDVKVVSGNPALSRPCAKVVSDWKFKPMKSRATAPLTFEFR
jgi:protein TonB